MSFKSSRKQTKIKTLTIHDVQKAISFVGGSTKKPFKKYFYPKKSAYLTYLVNNFASFAGSDLTEYGENELFRDRRIQVAHVPSG